MFSFYATHIFPRFMDWAMRSESFRTERDAALHKVYGTVLEVGFGTGLNFAHYPQGVTSVTAADPAIMLPHKVAERSAHLSLPVEVVQISAERLPFGDGQFDCALSTWTLCTIPDVTAALREIRRVLKPSGMLVFLEHGRSDDPHIAKWQDRFNPIQQRIACGCNLNRPIDRLIEQAGFILSGLERYEMKGLPRIAAHMYRGTASPRQTTVPTSGSQ